MGFESLTPATQQALRECIPYDNRGKSLGNTKAIIVFWKKRQMQPTAFLNLKNITPDMAQEIREKILTPARTSS